MNAFNSRSLNLYRCPRCHKEFGSAKGYIDHDKRYNPEKAEKARDLVGKLVISGGSIFGKVIGADECSGTVTVKGLYLSAKEYKTFGLRVDISGVKIETISLSGLPVGDMTEVGARTMREAYDEAITSMVSDLMCETLSIDRSDLNAISTDMFSGCKVRPEVVALSCCPKCGQCFKDQVEYRSHVDRCKGKDITDDGRVGAYGILGDGNRYYGRIHTSKSGVYGHAVEISETSDSLLASTTSDIKGATRTFVPRMEVADIAVTDFRERALAFFNTVLGGGERP